MSVPAKIKIASAVQKNGGSSRVDLSRKLLTSAKIGQIVPIFREALVPGDKISVNLGQFARFMPMSVPSYVKMDFKTLAVFVPYHQLADGCESYFANQPYFKGALNTIPQISDIEFGVAFKNQTFGTTTGASATNYDFYVGSTPYLATNYGRYALKFLANIGYNFYKHTFDTTGSTRNYNAMPLLSAAHAYNCYMSYAPYYNTSALSALLETIKRAPSTTITGANVITIIRSILLTYDSNIITSAWKYPSAGVNAGLQTAGSTNINQDLVDTAAVPYGWDAQDKIATGVEGGAIQQFGNNTELSAQQVRLLLQFDEYFRRTNYGGSKDIEQIYSRFGVKIDDYKTRYPYFLQSTSTEVRIGDVTSTSDTTGASLGSYAGKAIGEGYCNFSYDCHDYGFLIIFGWFAPRVQYILGMDKETLRVNPLDFYNPELDQGFADPLLLQEVTNLVTSNSAYGYVPLYSQYLFANDTISGDFRVYSGMDSWHFGRENWNQYVTCQSDILVYMDQIGTEYERIFNVDPSMVDVDTIYLDVRSDVTAVRPMKDFSGKSMLGEGGIDVPLNGTMIN